MYRLNLALLIYVEKSENKQSKTNHDSTKKEERRVYKKREKKKEK